MDELTECVSCMAPMIPSENNLHALQCGHVFHAACTLQYALIAGVGLEDLKCPVCKNTSVDMGALARDSDAFDHAQVLVHQFNAYHGVALRPVTMPGTPGTVVIADDEVLNPSPSTPGIWENEGMNTWTCDPDVMFNANHAAYVAALRSAGGAAAPVELAIAGEAELAIAGEAVVEVELAIAAAELAMAGVAAALQTAEVEHAVAGETAEVEHAVAGETAEVEHEHGYTPTEDTAEIRQDELPLPLMGGMALVRADVPAAKAMVGFNPSVMAPMLWKDETDVFCTDCKTRCDLLRSRLMSKKSGQYRCRACLSIYSQVCQGFGRGKNPLNKLTAEQREEFFSNAKGKTGPDDI
jgi:hypothetical protein